MSSHSPHHPQDVLLAQCSLYLHKGGLKRNSFHFISLFDCRYTSSSKFHILRKTFMKLRVIAPLDSVICPVESTRHPCIVWFWYQHDVNTLIIVRFTLNSSTRINEFRGFLIQFSTNFHEILYILFSIHFVTTLTIPRSFDKYFRS